MTGNRKPIFKFVYLENSELKILDMKREGLRNHLVSLFPFLLIPRLLLDLPCFKQGSR